MNIEQVATAAVTRFLSRNSYLNPDINANDSVPVWDGDVLVYRTKDTNKKNKNLIGKVPVQVKGHQINFSKIKDVSNIKFRVKKDDMEKYLTDGGAVYIVVLMDDEKEEVYYNSLLSLDLERLIKRYENQETFEIDIKPLPTDDIELADIFVEFIENKKKQLGTLNPTMLYMDDIQEFQNDIEEYKFGFSTVNSRNKNPLQELSKRTFYIYAKPKGIGNPIPIEKVSDAIISLQDTFKVEIEDKVYYETAYVQWEKGISKIVCSDGVFFHLSEDDNEENGISVNINIKLTGQLEERLNDLKFIQSLSITDELIIGDQKVTFQDFQFGEISEIEIMITELEKLKERLGYFGYIDDINLDFLKPEEHQILTFLMEDKPLIKEYSIKSSGLMNIEIAGISLIVLVEKNETDGYYTLSNFFEKSWEIVLIDSESNISTPISQFLVLDNEGLLADNIQSDKIIEDIKAKHTNNMQIEIINAFLLEAIKAYDEKEWKESKKEELKNIILKLSNWLYEKNEEDYIFMNVAQVNFRLGILDSEDIEKIKSLDKSNLEMQAGALILLKKYDQARSLLDNMEDEERELFMSYPIYNIMSMTE